jgi:hypothetical protein
MKSRIRYEDLTAINGEAVGEIGPPIPDFLPLPDQLVFKQPTVKVTLALSRRSLDFFKRQARRQRVSYQRMIRELVDAYAAKHGQ